VTLPPKTDPLRIRKKCYPLTKGKQDEKEIHSGRPKKDEQVTIRYKIKSELYEDESKIAYALESKGKFIIATNELDKKLLSVEDLLKIIKVSSQWREGLGF